ncbi:MAG: hypothetical protein ACI89J_001921 [Hyphomicrobiaceae bacterium]|jgi:hypothetical protein
MVGAGSEMGLRLWGIGLFLAIASVCAPVLAADDAPKTLSTAELKALLSGNSLAGNGKIKDPAVPYDWVAHYAADGVLRLKLKPEWGGKLIRGKWWLTQDGQQCRKFETGHAKEGCWRFVREGKFVRFLPASGVAVEGRAVRLKGDQIE